MGSYAGPIPKNPLWIHAVSVGEVTVASTLIRALPADIPLLVTTITPTGQERAKQTLGDRATVTYLPFDLDITIQRFLRRFQPHGLILVEGDLWPLLLKRVAKRNIPVVVINGRVSDHSFSRMRRLRPLLGPLFDHVDRFGMQTTEDGERLRDLAVSPERVEILGNIKFDSPTPAARPDVESRLRALANGRTILIAGSTMPAEEDQILEAFHQAGGGENAMLILAPRHPERWAQVEVLVQQSRFRCLRRTDLETATTDPDVIILDTLGELASLYRIALSSFIGGTLVPTGGHNPIEAAQHASAVVVGPSMENFREIARVFNQAEAWVQIGDSRQLAEVWSRWLSAPEQAEEVGARGKKVVDSNRGALDRTLTFVQPLVERVPRP
jgi:3-deoxy-D-manno-octulosonic-acid transferase